MGEKHADREKASHRGHGGHRGGIGLVDERGWWTSVADGRETRESGESIAQRSQRPQRGSWYYAERLSVDTGVLARTGKKRTIGNQRPKAIEELTKRKAARNKRWAGVRKLASKNSGMTAVRCILSL